jgi:hypothetical protein
MARLLLHPALPDTTQENEQNLFAIFNDPWYIRS